MVIKLRQRAKKEGHNLTVSCQTSATECIEPIGGTFRSSIRRVIAIAKTPSENAFNRSFILNAQLLRRHQSSLFEHRLNISISAAEVFIKFGKIFSIAA